jgi:hypothetical protein
MSLRVPPPTYSQIAMADLVRALDAQDQQNHKKGRDIYVAPGRLILTSANGTRYVLTVSDAGALSTVPL